MRTSSPRPRRRHQDHSLQLNAVQVIRILGLLPLATSVVAFALVSRWDLPSPTRTRGHPRVYSDASVLLIALLARLWKLSSSSIVPPVYRSSFLLSPANKNDLPFAYPLLWVGRFLLALPIHVVHADGAYWGKELIHFIVTVIGAHPTIPFNRKKQLLARVRHLVYWPLSYLAWAIIERFIAAAKRSYGLNTSYRLGWDALTLQVTLTFCAILIVALLADASGRPDLRLSPTRVLAHYLPVQEAL